ncbi:hypothetical protein ACMFMG_009082 [Clarireedia jacksonii]
MLFFSKEALTPLVEDKKNKEAHATKRSMSEAYFPVVFLHCMHACMTANGPSFPSSRTLPSSFIRPDSRNL